jgi:hypothetical protein
VSLDVGVVTSELYNASGNSNFVLGNISNSILPHNVLTVKIGEVMEILFDLYIISHTIRKSILLV